MKRNLSPAMAILFFVLFPVSAVFAQQEIDPPVDYPSAVMQNDEKSASSVELSIDSRDKVFKVGEKIVFDLVVTNKGRLAIKAFGIDEKTTFCSFNKQEWGTRIPSGEPVVVLMPGEVIRKKFRISGMRVPGKFNVVCSYGMGDNGVRPTVQQVLNIVR